MKVKVEKKATTSNRKPMTLAIRTGVKAGTSVSYSWKKMGA